ncbi:MAG TPA: hypothetical protein VFX02_08745 [Gammaproteobacteria bacterium]|nr:hypothetical protein [Gammaproteobacteria bacterium]
MAYINWSDAEDMFGLLIDYVHDARSDAGDARRRGFLSGLIRDLEALQERFDERPGAETVARLRDIESSIDEEFREDPVVEHLEACANELERVSARANRDPELP